MRGMAKPLLPRKGGLVRLSQELVQKQVTHPEWFHVFKENDQIQISVNMFRLPAPQRTLVADWAGAAVQGKTSVSFVFGQRPPGLQRMSGALVVQMARSHAQRALLSSTDFVEAIDKYARDNDISAEVHTPDAGVLPSERIVTERAQILSVVVGSEEAELRFYWTSQTDVHTILQEQRVDLVYPLVEVRMPAEEMVHLMRTIKELLGGMQP
jgi:hypothetical protein